jgi:hypothetical protein
VLRERRDHARGRGTAVRTAVEREVVPSVGVPLRGSGGKVGRIREYSVESAEAPRKIRPHHLQVETLRSPDGGESEEGSGVEVGRDHPGAPARRREGQEPGPGADVEEGAARVHSREW